MDFKEVSTRKLIEDFKAGSDMNEIRLRSAARVSGAFPLPTDLPTTPLLGSKIYNKRPFDETIFNINDSLIKKKQRRSLDESASDSLSETPTVALASPWEIRRMKGELVETKAEVSALEALVNQLHTLRKETNIIFEQEKASLKQSLEKERLTVQELESKIIKLRKREQSLKEETDNLLAMHIKDRQSLEAKNMEMLDENLELKGKISKLAGNSGEISRELNSVKLELENLKSELSSKTEQMEELNSQISELKSSLRQYEKDKALLLIAQQKISELESEVKNHAETVALVNSQQNKLLRCSELERQLNQLKQDNIKLREDSSKVVFLEGVVEELKARQSIQDERDKDLRSTKVELGIVMGQLNEFKNIAKSVVGEVSHAELEKYIRELQEMQVLAHSKVASLQARVISLEEAGEQTTSQCSSLKCEISKLKNEIEQNMVSIRRLKKQHAIITWERNDLRKMLDSIQKETTMASMDPKVEALEKLVDGYRKRMEEIESDHSLHVGNPVISKENSPELDVLKKEKSDLLQKIEKLEYELEHRNLKGDFDTRETRILHLKMNPTDEAIKGRQDTLEKCQAEVAMLKEKLRLVQEGQAADLTLTASDRIQQANSKEAEELREKVKSLEKHNQSLVKAFKATSIEFREAVTHLLGYNVASQQNNKVYKLSNIYAESADQQLLFKMTEGRMELLETEFSRTLSDLIDTHLRQQHSIPMFLSSITFELFNKMSQSSIISS